MTHNLNKGDFGLKPGDKIDCWVIESKINKTQIFKVHHPKTKENGAMKVEIVERARESLLGKQSLIYNALTSHTLGPRHVIKILGLERVNEKPQTVFLILEFLGLNIKELKEKCGGKFELSTVLRIGIQTLCGIKILHDVGYVHRNLHPSCFMLGNPDNLERCRVIYVTDFRIAKKFIERTKNNMGIYREERKGGSVRMHGYVRYVSVSVHNGNTHRCRDDIWSWIYILAELLDKLPWQNIKVDPTQVQILKMITPDSQLFSTIKDMKIKSCFTSILEYIRAVHADSKPDYVGIYNLLKNAASMCGSKLSDPYDWESQKEYLDTCFLSEADLQKYFGHEEIQIVRKGDQRVKFEDDISPKLIRRAPSDSPQLNSFVGDDETQPSEKEKAVKVAKEKKKGKTAPEQQLPPATQKAVEEAKAKEVASAPLPTDAKDKKDEKVESTKKKMKHRRRHQEEDKAPPEPKPRVSKKPAEAPKVIEAKPAPESSSTKKKEKKKIYKNK